MKPEERLAKQYLVSLSLGPVVYEPNKNQPPDFLIDGKIAVEVRRLNQNRITEAGYEGLETLRFRLGRQIPTLLSSLGPSNSGASWFLHYNFERPIPQWKEVRSALIRYLREFRGSPTPVTGRVVSAKLCKGFEVELRRAGNSYPQFFVCGGCIDEDTGGWALQETQKNLRICIEEKARKTAPFRYRYPEWWLVLIDQIGFGVDGCDRELFRKHLKFDHNWNKIILLNPQDPCYAPFELDSPHEAGQV